MQNKQSKNSSKVMGTAAFLWLAFLLAAYYAGHKPFNSMVALRLYEVLSTLLISLILLSICGGIGRIIMRSFTGTPMERFAVQSAMGMGIIGAGLLITGSLVGHLRVLIPVATVILLIILNRPIISWWRELSSLRDTFGVMSIWEKIVALMVSLLALCSLAVALAPPVSYDALTYHLAMPQRYLQLDRIVHLPEFTRSGFPQAGEMLYAWSIALGRLEAAPVFGWLAAMTAAIGLFGAIKRRLDSRTAWAGLAALFAGSTTVRLLGWAYVDWFSLVFGCAALILLLDWMDIPDRTKPFLIGLFCGFALTSKYSSYSVVIGIGLLLIYFSSKNKQWREPLWAAAGLSLPLILWWGRNWFTTGSPFYPFFLPAAQMDVVRLQLFSGQAPYGNWMDIFLMPLRATLYGFEHGEGYSADIGVLLLMLGCFCWVQGQHDPNGSKRPIVFISMIGIAAWVIGNQINGLLIQSRLHFALFPPLVMLAAMGYSGLEKIHLGRVRLQRLFDAVILLALVFNFWQVSQPLLEKGVVHYLRGITYRHYYLQQNLGWYQIAVEGLSELPPGSRTLFLYETRSLNCLPHCAADDVLDRWTSARLRGSSADETFRIWRTEGFTHILVNLEGMRFLVQANDPHHPKADIIALTETLSELPMVASYGSVYGLYSLP